MVSVNPSPTQGFYFFDPMNRGSKAMAQAVEGNKKVRKPYKITKSRESWTELEHDLFIEALHLFDRDWKKIEAFVGSKTVIQIRSHAQKYFLKVQKNNTSEHLPPPRPKRKAARPYPQKAPKDGPVVSQENLQHPAPSSFIEPGCMISSDVLGNTLATTSISAWSHNSLAVSTSQLSKDDDRISDPMIPNHCCSSVSIDSTPISWPNSWAIDDRNPQMPLRVMPDFAEVYRFIGSIFDPDTSDHLERLKEMDPINLETALLLMRNLCTNLMSPALEKHRKILGVYNDAPEKENSGVPFDLKCPSVILSA